jgi:hypothetical protein
MRKFALVLLSVLIGQGMWATTSFGAGACCLRDGSCTQEDTEGDCIANLGIYQGEGTDCPTTVCPSVEITNVSVDREADPTYQRLDTIGYTIEYTVVAATLGETYDLKAIVKPRFGKACKKPPPKRGSKGKAIGKDYGVGEGDHIMTIERRPNDPDKHYWIPKCAKEDKHVKVKYILKLYNAGTTDLVCKDTHIEYDQFYVESASGGNTCTACH